MAPSVPVKRKVTVPVGRFFKSGLPGTSGAASIQERPSAGGSLAPRAEAAGMAEWEMIRDAARERCWEAWSERGSVGP